MPWRAANSSAFCSVRDAIPLTSTPGVSSAGAKSPYGTTLAVPNTPKRIIDCPNLCNLEYSPRVPGGGVPTAVSARILPAQQSFCPCSPLVNRFDESRAAYRERARCIGARAKRYLARAAMYDVDHLDGYAECLDELTLDH